MLIRRMFDGSFLNDRYKVYVREIKSVCMKKCSFERKGVRGRMRDGESVRERVLER